MRPRYAPSKSERFKPLIDSILTWEWMNTATICGALGTWTDNGDVRTALRAMADAGAIARMVAPGRGAGQVTYLYRRVSL